jgi:hypothetical protein
MFPKAPHRTEAPAHMPLDANAAMAIAADRTQASEVRRVAALIAALLLRYTRWTERTTWDVIDTLTAAADCHQAAPVFAELLLQHSSDIEDAAKVVTRLAERALDEGHRPTALALSLLALRHGGSALPLQSSVAATLFSWAICEGNHQDAVELIALWLGSRGTEEPWVINALESNSSLLQTEHLSRTRKQALHSAAPTVAGWHAFATGAERTKLIWSASAFGQKLDRARATLTARASRAAISGSRSTVRRFARTPQRRISSS